MRARTSERRRRRRLFAGAADVNMDSGDLDDRLKQLAAVRGIKVQKLSAAELKTQLLAKLDKNGNVQLEQFSMLPDAFLYAAHFYYSGDDFKSFDRVEVGSRLLNATHRQVRAAFDETATASAIWLAATFPIKRPAIASIISSTSNAMK